MEDYKVLKKGDFVNGNIDVLEAPKKLKTRAMDYINIKNSPVTVSELAQEEPKEEIKVEEKQEEPINEKAPKEEIKVEEKQEEPKEEVKEEPKEEEKEEKVEEKKEDIGVFAYSAHKNEEEIDPDAIKQIKDLGDAYKGQPKAEPKKPVEEKKEEKKKVTDKEFKEALDKDSFSPKTKEYKNKIRQEYNKILEEIEENKRQLSEVTASYGEEKNVGNKLQDKKSDSEKVMDGINALPLDFLVGRKDQKSIDALTILESLFNEHRQIIIDTMQEIKKCDERKKEISKKEQAVRNDGVELNNKKSEFEEKNYSKITSINEIDEETRKLEESLTEVTGIKEVSNNEESETNRVLVSNVTNTFGEVVNPFDRVRSDSVNPEIPSVRKAA